MSAIAGIVNLHADENIMDAMLLTMRHRGTDGKGTYSHNEYHLLHTRSSVTDLAGGAQPMILDQGRERYILVFDGNLYNKKALRSQLLSLGHHFYGYSDGEVMLHAYAQWKVEALEKCNGVFSFAVLHEHTGELFLARDRVGAKPLFYMHQDNHLLFASEIKTILTHPGAEAVIDREGAAELLLLGPGRTPGSGVFRGIRELEPGCCATFRSGKMHITRYWKLMDRPNQDSFSETVQKVSELVREAVSLQMQADVPVGTFLSGGLDSSLVSALCARELEQQGRKLSTFSLDYLDHEKYFTPGNFQPNSDTEYIRIMQAYLDSDHHWTVLKPEDLAQYLVDAVIARDLPGMADVDSSLLAFCGHVRPYVNVVLSGECADEIFGGYPWYRDPTIRNMDGFPWAQTSRERTAFLASWLKDAIDPEEFILSRYHQTISECDILPENNESEKRMKEMVNLNFRWFMQTLLDRGDRMGMYHGLEIRVPLCDYRIAEYLYSVPWAYKEYKGQEKGLLRQAMRELLPQSVLLRKKSPFPKTHDPKYLQIVSDLLRVLLQDKNAPIYQLVRHDALENLLTQDFPWPWYGQLMRRPQTIGYMLQINYWLEHYSVKIV